MATSARFICCSFAGEIIRAKSVSVSGLLRGDGLNRDPRPFERSTNLHDAFRPRRFWITRRGTLQRQIGFAAKADATLQADFLLCAQAEVIHFHAAGTYMEYGFTVGPSAGARVRRA